MLRIVTTIAVLMLAVAANASAAPVQDFRSPDAQPAVANQDLRSPDAARPHAIQPAAQPQQVPSDLRSPDASESGRFLTTAQPVSTDSPNSFDWAYIAIGFAASLLLVGGVAIATRRRRHGLALGG